MSPYDTQIGHSHCRRGGSKLPLASPKASDAFVSIFHIYSCLPHFSKKKTSKHKYLAYENDVSGDLNGMDQKYCVVKEDLCAIHNIITPVEFYKCWILRRKDKEKTADHNRMWHVTWRGLAYMWTTWILASACFFSTLISTSECALLQRGSKIRYQRPLRFVLNALILHP